MINFSKPMSELKSDFTDVELTELDSIEAHLKELQEGKRNQIMRASDEIDRLNEGCDLLRSENGEILKRLTLILEEKLRRLSA